MLGITAIVACLAAGKLVHGAASPDKTYEVFAAVPGSMILAAGFMSTAASYADSYDDAMSTGAAVCNTLSGCIGYIVGSNGPNPSDAYWITMGSGPDTTIGAVADSVGGNPISHTVAWRYNARSTTGGSTCHPATDTFDAAGRCNCAPVIRQQDGPFGCKGILGPSATTRRRSLQKNRIAPGEPAQPYFVECGRALRGGEAQEGGLAM